MRSGTLNGRQSSNCDQDEEGNHKLPQNEVTAIKQELVGLMISVPPNIQSQLGDAVGIIADSDFWQRWDTLVDVSEMEDSQWSPLLMLFAGLGIASDSGQSHH